MRLLLQILVLPWILVSSNGLCPAPLPCTCEGDVINCEGKNLSKIPDFAPSSHVYKKLILSTNDLEEIQTDAFKQIHVVSIEIQHNPSLTSVQQSAFSRLPHLKEVHLDNNNILSLKPGAFSNLPVLTRLDLSHNKLTTILNATFVNLPKLEFLFMDFNNISTVEIGTFIKTTRLSFINLGFNSLMTLDYDVICHIGSLTSLNLSKNKLVCSCSLSWVEQWRTVEVLTQAGTHQIYGSCKRRDINANSALYVHIFQCPDIVRCRSDASIVG